MTFARTFTDEATGTTAVYLAQEQADSALVLAAQGKNLPAIAYWGPTLAIKPEKPFGLDLFAALNPQRVSGALDLTAWPSILPTQSEGWVGLPRLSVRRKSVELFPHFTVTQTQTEVVNSVAVVTITASDPTQGIDLLWTCEIQPSGVIRQKAAITNTEQTHLSVDRVELAYPVPSHADEILTTTGHHLRERSPQRQPLTVGRFERLAIVGRPDFDASLLLSAGPRGFGFETGDVYSTHVGWSGNSTLTVEKTPYTQAIIGGGEYLFGGEVCLEEGEAYDSPWVYGVHGNGLNEVAAQFHRFVRDLHPHLAANPRPVLLNTWEAVYFDHSYETLTALADVAKETGVERFVVDDGWFMGRRDDTAGLGDWQVDPAVWPEGLEPLSRHVHGLGMEFGLWFEPEMINPISQTARDHPDWILAPSADRLPVEGRSQQVLDLTNPRAYEYIFAAMEDLIGRLGIDYIKWDHNRFVTEAVSQITGIPAVHGQTLAVYRLFDEFKAAHPGLEIESCSSGGGRIDLGILEHADRVWVSDCVDPVERADIQRYTSLLVPPEMMGEHVGDSPAHSTGRATSASMRAATAFFGHLGIEWNLLKVPAEQRTEISRWIQAFKTYRTLFAAGSLVHMDAMDPSVRVDGIIAADKTEAVMRFTQLVTSQNYPPQPIRIPGLDPEKTYKVTPLPVSEDLTDIGTGQSPLLWWNTEGTEVNGQVLGSVGIRPPQLNPAEAVLFSLKECR